MIDSDKIPYFAVINDNFGDVVTKSAFMLATFY
jgi:hypothetical protein